MLKLRTLLRLIATYWKIIVPIIILAGIAGILMYQQLAPKAIPASDQAYPAIKLGTTTSTQLNSQIGQPYTAYAEGDYFIKSQKSVRSPYKPDLFYLKDDVVVLKEEWFEPTIYYYAAKDFIAKFGQPEKTLYNLGPSDVTTKALLYPSHGIAAFTIEDTGTITHIQYFLPTSLPNYLKMWGQNLGDKKDIKPFQLEPPEIR